MSSLLENLFLGSPCWDMVYVRQLYRELPGHGVTWQVHQTVGKDQGDRSAGGGEGNGKGFHLLIM